MASRPQATIQKGTQWNELVYRSFEEICHFSGRARRTEYWMFTLFNLIAAIILMAIDGALGSTPIIYSIYMLAVLLLSLAVTIRRLHDTDRSGWW